MKETIGQRVLATVLSYQLGISAERAMNLYVRNRKIHPSWETVGEELLNYSKSPANGPAVRKSPRKNRKIRAACARR